MFIFAVLTLLSCFLLLWPSYAIASVASLSSLTKYDYPDGALDLWSRLVARVNAEPFHLIAAVIFFCAVLHTFGAAGFTRAAQALQARHNRKHAADKKPHQGMSLMAAFVHELGEIEAIFGIWAAVLLVVLALFYDWHTAVLYFSGLDYKEPVFVVVVMSIAASRPIILTVERAIQGMARLVGGTPGSFWFVTLTLGPLLGSLITEPAAITICALLLSHRFYEYKPSLSLRYATIGLLFVNISIGGTMTNFAAPPVLMVSSVWRWSSQFMFIHFGAEAFIAIVISAVVYRLIFRREFDRLAQVAKSVHKGSAEGAADAVPAYLVVTHAAFLLFTIVNAHYPVMVIGSFCFYLAFMQMTHQHQHELKFKSAFMVGFFLAGLVVHGNLQGWWISPLLQGLGAFPLFAMATFLTSFVDNAMITYLATFVEGFSDPLKIAVVAGAVTGGGVTVIANAPNPAGRSLLAHHFPGKIVSPLYLLLAAAVPTVIAGAIFWWLR